MKNLDFSNTISSMIKKMIIKKLSPQPQKFNKIINKKF